MDEEQGNAEEKLQLLQELWEAQQNLVREEEILGQAVAAQQQLEDRAYELKNEIADAEEELNVLRTGHRGNEYDDDDTGNVRSRSSKGKHKRKRGKNKKVHSEHSDMVPEASYNDDEDYSREFSRPTHSDGEDDEDAEAEEQELEIERLEEKQGNIQNALKEVEKLIRVRSERPNDMPEVSPNDMQDDFNASNGDPIGGDRAEQRRRSSLREVDSLEEELNEHQESEARTAEEYQETLQVLREELREAEETGTEQRLVAREELAEAFADREVLETELAGAERACEVLLDRLVNEENMLIEELDEIDTEEEMKTEELHEMRNKLEKMQETGAAPAGSKLRQAITDATSGLRRLDVRSSLSDSAGSLFSSPSPTSAGPIRRGSLFDELGKHSSPSDALHMGESPGTGGSVFKFPTGEESKTGDDSTASDAKSRWRRAVEKTSASCGEDARAGNHSSAGFVVRTLQRAAADPCSRRNQLMRAVMRERPEFRKAYNALKFVHTSAVTNPSPKRQAKPLGNSETDEPPRRMSESNIVSAGSVSAISRQPSGRGKMEEAGQDPQKKVRSQSLPYTRQVFPWEVPLQRESSESSPVSAGKDGEKKRPKLGKARTQAAMAIGRIKSAGDAASPRKTANDGDGAAAVFSPGQRLSRVDESQT